MILGAYTFALNPSKINTLIHDKIKTTATVETLTDSHYFSWGLQIKGKVLVLSWRFMSLAQYAAIKALFDADVPVVFDPEDNESKTYNVELKKFSGTYHFLLSSGYRRNVNLELYIVSEV